MIVQSTFKNNLFICRNFITEMLVRCGLFRSPFLLSARSFSGFFLFCSCCYFCVCVRAHMCACIQHFLLQGLGEKHLGDCFSLLSLVIFFFSCQLKPVSQNLEMIIVFSTLLSQSRGTLRPHLKEILHQLLISD